MDDPVRDPDAAVRDERIELRVTKAGKERLVTLAAAQGHTVSDMARILMQLGYNSVAARPVNTRAIHPYPKAGKKT